MGETKIEWTWRRNPVTGEMMPGYTFNAWIGCTKVSPACANCYAESLDRRRFSVNLHTGGGTPEAPVSHWGHGAPRYRTKDWQKPHRWNREAAAMGYARACFTSSLADWADEEVSTEWLVDLLHLVRLTPCLDWLMLTKRDPGKALLRALEFLGKIPFPSMAPGMMDTYKWLHRWLKDKEPPHNVWLGATMEDQGWMNARIDNLLDVPAVVHFASVEPQTGRVVFPHDAFHGHDHHTLDWIISGGESCESDPKKARPLNPDWVDLLREQCWIHKVPFFFKQWGEWAPAYELDHNPQAQAMCAMDKVQRHDLGPELEGGRRYQYLVGVEMAGRTLNGEKWDQQPPLRELTTEERATKVAAKKSKRP